MTNLTPKIKDIFDPGDELARWILKLSIARNDLLRLNIKLVELIEREPGDRANMNLYLFRLTISHLRECAKMIYFGYRSNSIKRYIQSMECVR